MPEGENVICTRPCWGLASHEVAATDARPTARTIAARSGPAVGGFSGGRAGGVSSAALACSSACCSSAAGRECRERSGAATRVAREAGARKTGFEYEWGGVISTGSASTETWLATVAGPCERVLVTEALEPWESSLAVVVDSWPLGIGQGATVEVAAGRVGARVDAVSIGREGCWGPRRAHSPTETNAPMVALSAAVASIGRQIDTTGGNGGGGGGSVAIATGGGGIELGTTRGSGSGGGGGRIVVAGRRSESGGGASSSRRVSGCTSVASSVCSST